MSPVRSPPVVDRVVGVSAGHKSTCALQASGHVLCWGEDQVAGLPAVGDKDAPCGGSPRPKREKRHILTPRRVEGLEGIVDVHTSIDGIVALRSTGEVVELGILIGQAVPRPIGELPASKQIATNLGARCALSRLGEVSCWGPALMAMHPARPRGRPLGVALLLPEPRGGLEISVGSGFGCALLPTHTVTCWGNNRLGTLGNGKRTEELLSYTPASEVIGLEGVVQISAGESHTCALLGSGVVKCWGGNYQHELGVADLQPGCSDEPKSCALPVEVRDLPPASAIAGGAYHTCALLRSGHVACWGSGHDGQLGGGKREKSDVPSIVDGVTDAVRVSSGFGHACALTQAGDIWCWGWNEDGQLGDGTREERAKPVRVKLP
ncbi:MAG: hypothetical protein HY898_21005 [Deltaproteobacteria bacterium]|nr:hypothetical protein [Deltaproteobacteria bacterium]